MADEKVPCPLEHLRTTITDSASWFAERERFGATRVEVDSISDDAVVVFPLSTSSQIADPCVEI